MTYVYDAEAREEKIIDLIAARIRSIRTDILLGRQSTIDAIEARLQDDEEAAAQVQATVVGHSRAVGERVANQVNGAIYFEAEALAEQDVADMERRRNESADEEKIERYVWQREFA